MADRREPTPEDEERRDKAYEEANRRWPLPLEEDKDAGRSDDTAGPHLYRH